jgi:hypothetical protein
MAAEFRKSRTSAIYDYTGDIAEFEASTPRIDIAKPAGQDA